MYDYFRTLGGMVAAAILGAAMVTAASPQARAQAAGCGMQFEKKVKDQGEFDLYNGVLKDADPAKKLQDLNTWQQKYPESDYKDDRAYLYMQAYAAANQPDKVLEYSAQLMSKDVKCAFKEPQTVLAVMYLTCANILRLPAPTPEQLATADKAGHALLDYVQTFFAADKKPAATSEADWAKARADVETVGKAALLYTLAAPGNAALAKNTPADCAAAEAAYTKALQEYPDAPGAGQDAYSLGRSLICQQQQHPEKVPMALYEIARAVSMDPNKGGLTTQAKQQIDAYLTKIYTAYHGSADGLDQLKQDAMQSPLPPAGFTIKTGAQLAAEQEQQFAQSNPQLALWMGIKKQLADPASGQQYFDSQMKDANVPQLRGTLVEAKPACHPKELLVAVPLPGAQQLQPEITLKLDAPLGGKPAPNTEFRWQGVPNAFTQSPFMLTMAVEKDKIEGLKMEPCSTAPARKKSAVTQKKQ